MVEDSNQEMNGFDSDGEAHQLVATSKKPSLALRMNRLASVGETLGDFTFVSRLRILSFPLLYCIVSLITSWTLTD
jgi:hypothetical protein